MAKVIWSPKAVDLLENIAEYIACDSRFYAESTVNRIVKATRKLNSFPEFGARVAESDNPLLREIRVFSYRVIYQLNDKMDTVRIVGVVHGACLLSDVFPDEDFTK